MERGVGDGLMPLCGIKVAITSQHTRTEKTCRERQGRVTEKEVKE